MPYIFPDPSKLDYNDLVEVVRTIQRTLWERQRYTGTPGDGFAGSFETVVDPDVEWGGEVGDSVAGILHDSNLGPIEVNDNGDPIRVFVTNVTTHAGMSHDGPVCADCIPKMGVNFAESEVWEYGSDGWLVPLTCECCGASIEVEFEGKPS